MSQGIPLKKVTTFEQFRRFTTDAYGIERLLRVLQSTLQILSNKPPSLLSPIQPSPSPQGPLLDLAARIGQVRRTIRAFRFLTAFSNAHESFASFATKRTQTSPEAAKHSSPQTTLASPSNPETLLDGLAATFDGFYYLLETLTLPDALRIPGLRLLSPPRERALNLEAQRCWFFALVAGALACLFRLSRIPPATASRSHPSATSKGESEEHCKEPARSVQRSSSSAGDQRRRRLLLRKMALCLLDMALPGKDLGWIRAERGTVACVMLGTSLLTGFDVWDRLGRG